MIFVCLRLVVQVPAKAAYYDIFVFAFQTRPHAYIMFLASWIEDLPHALLRIYAIAQLPLLLVSKAGWR